ncbi:hypothetical protein [Holospora curviuscula]|nr:hypothetical protein [Holospora curviuscula]
MTDPSIERLHQTLNLIQFLKWSILESYPKIMSALLHQPKHLFHYPSLK